MRLLAGALVGLLLSTTSAHAYLKAGPNVAGQGAHHRLQGGTTVDTMATSLSAAYSFRKVRSAYAGSAVKLRRTTGGTQDIGFTAQGDFDTTTAATFCASTTCFVDTWYDQSTNARHMAQTFAPGQPAYIAGCIGTLPCLEMTSNGQTLATAANFTPTTGTLSISLVANRAVGLGQCTWLFAHGAANDRAYAVGTAANTWGWVGAAAGSVLFTAADAAWHSVQLTYAGAGSGASVDGVELAPQTMTGNTTAGLIQTVGDTGSCREAEILLWDAYALTVAERTALSNNQKQYYTPLPLDSFATPAAAYSMRRLKSSYTGPAIRLRRASDNAEQDIGFLSFTSFTGAPIDTAAANSFCAATTCRVQTWYDQSGSARHAMQVSGGGPVYVANCNGVNPCVRGANLDYLQSAVVTWASGKTSLSAVANRSSGTTAQCHWVWKGYNYLSSDVTANLWKVFDQSTAAFTMAAADAAWHAGIGVINGVGVSGLGRIDGTEMAGVEVWGNTTAATVTLTYTPGAGSTCDMTEAAIWDNYSLSLTERQALTANQRAFWGF